MLLSNFTPEQLDAAAVLISDTLFQKLVHYIADEVTALSLKSVRFSGEEGEKLKGACIAMQEFRDKLILYRDVQKSIAEEEELESLQGDSISP